MGCLITQGMRPRITKAGEDKARYIVLRGCKRWHGDDGQVRLTLAFDTDKSIGQRRSPTETNSG